MAPTHEVARTRRARGQDRRGRARSRLGTARRWHRAELPVHRPGRSRPPAVLGKRLVVILAPDWRPITWTQAERAAGQAWGLKTIESFHTHGTPPVHG